MFRPGTPVHIFWASGGTHPEVLLRVHTGRMRSNMLVGVVLLTAIFGFAGAARAQEPEVGVAYSYARITNGNGTNFPAGFLLSVAGGGRTSPWLVGEIAGNFKSEGNVTLKLWTIEGGVRFFTDIGDGVRPFAQLLIGLGTLRVLGNSANKFSIEPAAGIDLPIGQGIAFRAGVGFPVFGTDGENLKILRMNLGVVIGGR